MSDDSELFREHVERGSDDAFRTLVEHPTHLRPTSGGWARWYSFATSKIRLPAFKWLEAGSGPCCLRDGKD